MKGQASLEQIVLSAGLLALVATVFVLSANYSADTTEVGMAQDTVSQLTAAADFVYSLGPNSEEYVTIYIPSNMVSWNITGKAVMIRIQTNGGLTDISSYSKADLIGSLPSHSGTQRVLVEYLPSGVVRIGPGSLHCSPSTISRSFTAGNTSNEEIIITNIGNYNITEMNATLTGTGGEFASILGGTVPQSLGAGENASVIITYNVPGSAESGVYGAIFNIGSPEDSCFSQITLSVNNEPTCQEQCNLIGYTGGSCRASASQCILNSEDYRPDKDFACDSAPSMPSCCCSPTSDRQGPLAKITSLNVSNSSVLVRGICNDTLEGNSYISNAQMQINFGSWAQAYPINNGSFSSSPVLDVIDDLNNIIVGMNVIGLRCFDTANNMGFVDYVSFEVNYTDNCTDVNDCSIEDFVAPIVNSIWQNPSPAYRLQPLLIYANTTDTGNRAIKNCTIEADLSGNWQLMTPIDGVYDQFNETILFNYTAGFNIGTHIISVKCTDSANITGPNSYYFFNVTEQDIEGPIVINISHTPYPTTMTNVDLTATATDKYTGNSNLQSCQIKIDSSQWMDINAVEMPYDSPVENILYNVGTMGMGLHRIYYRCTDSHGNVGEIYNESFNIVDVDLMLVMDRSGSMDWNVTDSTSNNVVTAASTGWSWVKNMTVLAKNGNVANFTVETMASAAGCTVSYNATINGKTVATGSRTSTSYGSVTTPINISSYDAPYQVALYLKRDNSGCTAYARLMSLQQAPTKMIASQNSAKSFLDIAGSATHAGLVSYSTSATTDKQLAVMNPTNLNALKASIDAMVSSGSTCIECGLNNGVNELVSARGRANATRVMILLTDGVSNIGNSIDGAVLARNNNVTVYTIGFGNDVDDTELTNIALLTGGDYYYAPNSETLNQIFMNIGR
jgi:hypothetical protein